nr:hypothetical protein [Tanacetum cinerariifolium]
EDDHSPLLVYVVWIFLAYLTYPVIPPYLHSFGNEDTIFDPGITINRSYLSKPGLSHRELGQAQRPKTSASWEASPHDSEFVNVEVEKIVIPEDKEIEDDNLREKLLKSLEWMLDDDSWTEQSSLGCSSVPFLSPLIHSSMGELEIKSDATFDDDSFDSEGEKIKEAELLIDPLDLPCDILSEYDSFNYQDFSRDDFCSLLIMRTRFSCFQSQSDFLKPDEDFSCSKWKEYSSFGCSSVPFLSPLIRSSGGDLVQLI